MDTVSHLIRLARVDAALDKHCLLSSATTMEVVVGEAPSAPFHVLLEGSCQLQAGRHLLDLKAGDVVLLPRGGAHRIITSGTARQRGITETVGDAFTTTLSDGGGTPVIDLFCGHYTFGPGAGSILFRSLPDPLHVAFGLSEETDGVLRAISDLMRSEAARDSEGTAAILSALCTVLLTMVLRTKNGAATGAAIWTASVEKHVAALVEDVLRHPGRDWSIEHVSRRSSMSRATFLRRFERSMGTTYGAFVSRTRLMVAADLLQTTDLTVSGVAAEIGYQSESAFARAFKKETGLTPARFRRQHHG